MPIQAENQIAENWFGDVQQLHESTDVTNLILPGTNTYALRDHEHGISPLGSASDRNLNYGFGIWVVYDSQTTESYGEIVC